MALNFQLKQRIKMFSQNVYLPAVYNFHRCQKVDRKLVIFADAHHDSRPEAMELLYRRLRYGSILQANERQEDTDDSAVRKQTQQKSDSFHIVEMYLDFSKASAKQILAYSTHFMKLYACASVVVICDNFLPVASCRKKKDTLVIQLWHGCGCYKKFGYDAPDDIPEGYKGDVFRNMDLVTVSAEAAVGPFSSAMHKTHGEVQPLGVSRTDLYYSESWRESCIRNFMRRYPGAYEESQNALHKRKKIVLWAPTFRGNAGKPELLNLDTEKLQKELGDDYLVLTRVHPHMKEAQKALKANCPIPTEQLYPVVDVLIADYSSLIYEYLLVKRIWREEELKETSKETPKETSPKIPKAEETGGLVLYAPDLGEYQSRRGFYMDIHEIPGEIVRKEKELTAAVRRASGQESVSQKSDAFLNRYMSACDGQATERIAGRIRGCCAEAAQSLK